MCPAWRCDKSENLSRNLEVTGSNITLIHSVLHGHVLGKDSSEPWVGTVEIREKHGYVGRHLDITACNNVKMA